MYFLDYKKKIYISKISKNLIEHDFLIFWNYKNLNYNDFLKKLIEYNFKTFWLKRSLFNSVLNKNLNKIIKTQSYVSFNKIDKIDFTFLNKFLLKDKNLLLISFLIKDSGNKNNNILLLTKKDLKYINNFANKYRISLKKENLNSLYSIIYKNFVINNFMIKFLYKQKLMKIFLLPTYKKNFKTI